MARRRDGERSAYNWGAYELLCRLLRDDPRCSYCRCAFDPAFPWHAGPTLDHLQPRSRGGSDAPGNLVLACYRCNTAKGSMLLLDFLWSRAAPPAR